MTESRENLRLRDTIDTVVAERKYQQERWSSEDDAAKTPEEWLTVLGIYIGKAGMESPLYQGQNFSMERFRKRIKQLTAVGIAILEATSNAQGNYRGT